MGQVSQQERFVGSPLSLQPFPTQVFQADPPQERGLAN